MLFPKRFATFAATMLLFASAAQPAIRSMTSDYPAVTSLPSPKSPPKSKPNASVIPGKSVKSNACYVTVDPSRGCRYPDLHEIGEKCYCNGEGKTLEGSFLFN